MMKKSISRIVFSFLLLLMAAQSVSAQQRRPIDAAHPLWLVHIDVWNVADPQKIIDLIPEDVKPYVCMNLSLSCQYDKEKNVYKMPRCAVRTYKSWATVCQQNGLWFTCQPASGGHTHIQDDDLVTFEYFFKHYPNFLGWNYAEQFWGFDEAGDKSSSTQTSRWELFANLVEMSHQYGGFLTVSFCGNIWSHGLNPIGQMKRNQHLLEACRKYPEAILWLYKYTTSSCFYNNESVTFSPFISGLAKNYGVRYDNCGWNGAMESLVGKDKCKYPVAAGIGTVMEQTGINGGAVWDGPELIWTEDFRNIGDTTVDGYKRRNWTTFPGFDNIWIDMFRKVIDGTLRIPTREEVVDRTKIVVVNDINTGGDEQRYAAWGNLYDGLYKQDDPANRGNGQWMDNFCYFKKTGRYATIPVALELYDDVAKSIPVQVKKSQYSSRWSTIAKKVEEFNAQYPEVSKGDLFVARIANQLVTYTPYTYLNKKKTAQASIPLVYNTCDTLELQYGKLSSGLIREYADHIDLYLNNYRTDTTAMVTDKVIVKGATAEPSYTFTKRVNATCTSTASWEDGIYTITVSHNGPVDITIQCAGTASRNDQAAVSQPLSLPQQPAEYNGPIIIEAEDMDMRNVAGATYTNSGYYVPDVLEYAGNGYVDFGSNTSAALRHQLKMRQGGAYTLTVRYTNTQRAGNIYLMMNGSKHVMACDKTAKNEWKKASVNVTLNAGMNDLTISNSAGVPLRIDQIIYAPEGMEAEKFLVTVRDADHGKVVANTNEAAEGETVTLTVDAESGYQLQELRVVNSVYYTMEKTIAVNPDDNEITFTMPDDNVTLQPVFADMSSVYHLDFNPVMTGTIPEGWRCTQESNEVHEYPNNYSAGARTFAGFTGYQGKALYWREESAEYGRQSAYPLTLQPGNYQLSFAMAAWKESPKYKVQVLNASTGRAVATSEVITATPNANGSTGANLTSAELHEIPVNITAQGNYIIRFTNESRYGYFDEYLLLACDLRLDPSSGIHTPYAETTTPAIYSISGVRQSAISRGLNIVRTADGKTKKVMVK